MFVKEDVNRSKTDKSILFMKFNFVGFLQFLSKQKDCAGEMDKFTYALIYL